jgi:hypothetical protein
MGRTEIFYPDDPHLHPFERAMDLRIGMVSRLMSEYLYPVYYKKPV